MQPFELVPLFYIMLSTLNVLCQTDIPDHSKIQNVLTHARNTVFNALHVFVFLVCFNCLQYSYLFIKECTQVQIAGALAGTQ